MSARRPPRTHSPARPSCLLSIPPPSVSDFKTGICESCLSVLVYLILFIVKIILVKLLLCICYQFDDANPSSDGIEGIGAVVPRLRPWEMTKLGGRTTNLAERVMAPYPPSLLPSPIPGQATSALGSTSLQQMCLLGHL